MPRLSDSMEEGTILHLDEAGRGRDRGRRRDRRNRDRQGEHGLRERRGRDADRDPGRGGGDVADRDSDCAGRGFGRGLRAPSRGSWRRASADADCVLGPPAPPAGERQSERRPKPAERRPSGRRAGQSFAGRARMAKEKGVDLASIQGSGPGGRIVKADVKKAARRLARRRGRGADGRAPRGRRGRSAAGPEPAAETAKGQVDVRGPLEAAVDDRAADGGVEGDGAALLPGSGDRHEPGGRGAGADQGGGGRGRGRALLQRHGRQGLRAGAARAPAGQRRLPRRPLRALLAGQRRRRGRRPGRARRPDRLRRRPQGPAADRHRLAGAGAAGPRRARSPRRSSRAAPSPSPTWGCTGSTTSAP